MERTKERSSFRKKFIGDRKFYMMVLAVGCSDHDPEWNHEFRESAG